MIIEYLFGMKRLSIIVPMYNVEKYVERCIISLEKQDMDHNQYEIICVNDGSPDNSSQIIKQLKEKYNNIILIDQENQGVSVARNNGMDLATGEYILFIDPDDYVDENAFLGILERARKADAQVSFLGFSFRDHEEKSIKQWLNGSHTNDIFDGKTAYFLSRGDGSTDPDRMWAVLFKREFLNKFNLRFLPDVPYLEDGEFIARIMCLAEKVIFDGHSFYQRTTRLGSATNSSLFHSDRAHNGFVKAAMSLYSFRKNSQLDDSQRVFMNQPILKFSLLVLQSSAGLARGNKLRYSIKLLKRAGLRNLELRGCNSLYRFYGSLYNSSPYLAVLALFIYPKVRYIINKVKFEYR